MADKQDTAEVVALRVELRHLATAVERLNERVETLDKTVERGRGALRLLLWLGGLAGPIAGFGVWLAQHIQWRNLS